jgi:hypothetical protein
VQCEQRYLGIAQVVRFAERLDRLACVCDAASETFRGALHDEVRLNDVGQVREPVPGVDHKLEAIRESRAADRQFSGAQ